MADVNAIRGRFIILGQLRISVKSIEQSKLNEQQLTDILASVKRIHDDIKYFNAGCKDFHYTAIETDKKCVLYITSSKYGIKAFVVDENNHVINLDITIDALKRLDRLGSHVVDYITHDKVMTTLSRLKEDVQKTTDELFSNIELRGPPTSVSFNNEVKNDSFEVNFEDQDIDLIDDN